MFCLLMQVIVDWGRSFLGSVVFYTIIPLPVHWKLDFLRVARWASWIGLLLGLVLSLADWLLQQLGIGVFTGSAIVVALWLWLTGGLHFDGLIDTADGLAVLESERRLDVMQDSRVGAFGVMAAVVVLLLKTVALSEIPGDRCWVLIGSAVWGRWGQIMAIALYPYLKPTGKGAFHREYFQFPQDLIISAIAVIGVSCFSFPHWQLILQFFVIGIAIALSTGFYFYHRFGGHTGDTYGAVVEWTEALFLIFYQVFLT
jgi:adenosylcobinamide-GDP ribazoletransferase